MKVRYTYRLRPGRQAEQYLLAEWDACRYVWNRMVDESKARHELNRGETFGDRQAQKYLTVLRAYTIDKNGVKWLALHSCVPQQQIVRDYSKARKKALLDQLDNTIPVSRKAGMPGYKSRKTATPTLNYRVGGFALVQRDGKTRLRLPKASLSPSSGHAHCRHLRNRYASTRTGTATGTPPSSSTSNPSRSRRQARP